MDDIVSKLTRRREGANIPCSGEWMEQYANRTTQSTTERAVDLFERVRREQDANVHLDQASKVVSIKKSTSFDVGCFVHI
eukprot:scaffold10856_cov229-Amphora_coffeaeformis.AAC.8